MANLPGMVVFQRRGYNAIDEEIRTDFFDTPGAVTRRG